MSSIQNINQKEKAVSDGFFKSERYLKKGYVRIKTEELDEDAGRDFIYETPKGKKLSGKGDRYLTDSGEHNIRMHQRSNPLKGESFR